MQRCDVLAACAELLAHVDVVVRNRRLGPMPFEEAVSLSHELVREGIPLAEIRLAHAGRGEHAVRRPAAPHAGARARR